MDILITLITEMVTRMCAHAQTQETVYITMYRFFLCTNYTSVKLKKQYP